MSYLSNAKAEIINDKTVFSVDINYAGYAGLTLVRESGDRPTFLSTSVKGQNRFEYTFNQLIGPDDYTFYLLDNGKILESISVNYISSPGYGYKCHNEIPGTTRCAFEYGGTYETFNDCQSGCRPSNLRTFSCKNGACVEDPNGPYRNNQCDYACVPANFSCIDGTCVRDDEHGTSQDPVNCCTEQRYGWNMNGECVKSASGKYINDPTCGGKPYVRTDPYGNPITRPPKEGESEYSQPDEIHQKITDNNPDVIITDEKTTIQPESTSSNKTLLYIAGALGLIYFITKNKQ
jgi:hypothetical protein